MAVQAQYQASLPGVQDKQYSPLQCDENGYLRIVIMGSELSAPLTQTEFLAARRATVTRTTVNSGAASVTLIAVNSSRKALSIANSDPNRLHINLAGGTATNDDVSVEQRGYWEANPGGVPTNAITGIWEVDGAGVAVIYEGA